MTPKIAGVLLGLVMLAVLVAGVWYQRRYPREILSTATIRVESRTHPGAPMTLSTRLVAIGPRRIEEVRMPNGTWIDCAGDCRRAALEAGPEMWEAMARRGG